MKILKRGKFPQQDIILLTAFADCSLKYSWPTTTVISDPSFKHFGYCPFPADHIQKAAILPYSGSLAKQEMSTTFTDDRKCVPSKLHKIDLPFDRTIVQ